MPWASQGMSPSFRASSSKTAMNSAPMRLRLTSGSVTPSSCVEESRGCVDVDEVDLEGVPERVPTTPRPRPCRSRPLSTNTQVSWSPIARWTSTATTDESTPPESAQRTRSRPTCARISSTAVSMNDGHRPRRRARRRGRGSSRGSSSPAACARPRGGTGRRRAAARSSAMAATGQLAVAPSADEAPGGAQHRVAVAHPHRDPAVALRHDALEAARSVARGA